MCGVRPDEGRGAVTRVTLESLQRLEAVEADPVQAGEAGHEAQRPGVQAEDVSPEAEAQTGPEHPLVDGLGVQHGPVRRVEVPAVPEHGRHVAGGAAHRRVSQM